MAQISFSLNGAFYPTIFPLFQNILAVELQFTCSMVGSFGDGAGSLRRGQRSLIDPNQSVLHDCWFRAVNRAAMPVQGIVNISLLYRPIVIRKPHGL